MGQNQVNREKSITTAPSTTRTTPVARLRVLGEALLANTAAIRAQINVNTTHKTKTVQSGAPRPCKLRVDSVMKICYNERRSKCRGDLRERGRKTGKGP